MYVVVILLQGAQAHGKQTGLVYWVKTNPAAAKAGGGRASSGKEAKAGVKAGAGTEVGTEVKAKASNNNNNSGGSL